MKQSTPGETNVGFIFTSMILSMEIGMKLYELLIIHSQFDCYMSIAGCLFFQGLLLFLVYYVEGFLPRMIILALFNGLTGFYNPLNSLVKSSILEEKYRYLLMNLFKIPSNIIIIIVLLIFRYINSVTIALIIGTLCFVASSLGIFLVIYLKIFPEKKLGNEYNTNISIKEKQL